jgi:hypothetical protein
MKFSRRIVQKEDEWGRRPPGPKSLDDWHNLQVGVPSREKRLHANKWNKSVYNDSKKKQNAGLLVLKYSKRLELSKF